MVTRSDCSWCSSNLQFRGVVIVCFVFVISSTLLCHFRLLGSEEPVSSFRCHGYVRIFFNKTVGKVPLSWIALTLGRPNGTSSRMIHQPSFAGFTPTTLWSRPLSQRLPPGFQRHSIISHVNSREASLIQTPTASFIWQAFVNSTLPM